MNETCIDCGWYGDLDELDENENGTKCKCPECGSELVYSDEELDNS